MKQFDCADVVPGCGATFRARTADEVLALGRAHAVADHGLTAEAYTPELEAAVRALVRDAA